MYHLSFFDWLILLSIISSEFTHVVAYGRIAFFFFFFWGQEIFPTFSLSIHLSWTFVYTPWLLWKMLQWIWKCKYLLVILISVLLDKYSGVEFLNHMVILFSIFWGTPILFPIVAALFYILTNHVHGFQCFHIFANTFLSLSLFFFW